jgi:di/tricarboxylate transporter
MPWDLLFSPELGQITPIILTLAVTVTVLVFSVREWLPLDIISISAAAALMLMGLVTPEEGISGFGNAVTITVMAMFILSAGIDRSGAIQIINKFFVKWGGKHPVRQILLLGVIVGPITAFINNTAVVAVFIPVVEDWCKQRGTSVSKLLMPLSFITVLGGMITVIGTSTSVLASGISKRLGYGEFGLFEFSKLGIITFLIGLVFLAVTAPALLPSRIKPTRELVQSDYNLKIYISEIVITSDSQLVGQMLGESCLNRSKNCPLQRFDIDTLELIRDKIHFSHPLDRKILQAGDVLIVRAGFKDLIEIKAERGIEIHPELRFAQPDLNSEDEGLVEALIPANSSLIGSTLKDSQFRQQYNSVVLAVRHGDKIIRERLNNIPLRFGDVLLIQGPKQSLIGLQANPNLIILDRIDVPNPRQGKAGIAIVITLAVVVLAAFDLVPIMVSSLIGSILMVLTGCLKPGELYTSIRWDIIFLIAGLIPLGIAMEKSGATQLLANGLTGIGGGISGYWLLTIFYIITSIVTELLSNSATVVLLIPIAAKVAEQLSLNPIAFIFAVTFAASNSFMTPIGYQANTMVYGPGGYKFTDFVRLGLPLNFLMTIVTPPLIILFYGL